MNELDSNGTFRGLPLTAQQDSGIRHYIHCRQRSKLPWNTPELDAMLRDMLQPPELEDEASLSVDGATARERGAAHDGVLLDADADADAEPG